MQTGEPTDCAYPVAVGRTVDGDLLRQQNEDSGFRIAHRTSHIASHIADPSAHLSSTGSYLFLSGGLAISRFARELGYPTRLDTAPVPKRSRRARSGRRRESGRAGRGDMREEEMGMGGEGGADGDGDGDADGEKCGCGWEKRKQDFWHRRGLRQWLGRWERKMGMLRFGGVNRSLLFTSNIVFWFLSYFPRWWRC